MLVEMTKFEGTHHGKKIASQMLDVTIRVKDVRSFAVRQMVRVAETTSDHPRQIFECLFYAKLIPNTMVQ